MDKLTLVGQDGNAYAIIGYVVSNMRKLDVADRIDKYIEEATAGTYDDLICVSMRAVDELNKIIEQEEYWLEQ